MAGSHALSALRGVCTVLLDTVLGGRATSKTSCLVLNNIFKMNSCRKYLFWFANTHIDFRMPEFFSALSIFDVNCKFLDNSFKSPFLVVELPSEAAACQIASRSVLLRWCIELWAQGKSDEEFHKSLKTFPLENMRPYLTPQLSFKVNVETFCNTLTQKEKVAKIESLSYLPVQGPVDLKNPDICLHYIEDYGLDSNNVPEKPYNIYFGRLVAEGQREKISKLSLKNRKFIGNTSMDAELSLIMANQAKITSGDIVLDPFVGSGSLLVAAAEFGGYVLGTDIDYLMLHAKTRPTRIKQKKRERDESIKANMEQYGRTSQYLDVLVADAAVPIWRSNLRLDAILTDPPYGVREATERIGSNKSYTISECHLSTHIPSKVEYELQHIYRDLLQFSARHLKMGGRLVCWVPIVSEHYNENKLPSHPCLNLIANSEQVLTKFTSRRLLTLEKVEEPQQQECTSFIDTSSEQFRAKFFRYGEDVRKQRKEQRALIRQSYELSRIENYSSTSTNNDHMADCFNSETLDRESSSSER